MTKKKGIAREEEHAKLLLVFLGLKFLRSKHPGSVHKEYLFQTDLYMDQTNPIIVRLMKNKVWMHNYLSNLERDNVLEQTSPNFYKITDLIKIDAILTEKEEYGAQKLGWYLAPKKIACPWEKNNPDGLEGIPVGDEVNDHSDPGEEPKQSTTELKEIFKENSKELISLGETIKLTLTELPKSLRSLLENNSTKEELSKVKSKLNGIEGKLGHFESLLEKQTKSDQELENRIATRVSVALSAILVVELGPLKTEMISVKSDISKASSEIHKVIDELNTCRAREAKFFYEYFSELAEGVNKDGK